MRNGSFRSKRLADFISGSKCDYYGARDIINAPTDCPALIEGYAGALTHRSRRRPSLSTPETAAADRYSERLGSSEAADPPRT